MLGISKEIIHALPEVHYPGRVILIDSAAKAKDAVTYLKKQRQIGFDTETRPSFQKNHRYKVSLVQLSTPGECFLFRLKKIGGMEGLMSIFENPEIQKIGLSLKDDFHSLAKLCQFTPAGFVELQTFVKDFEIADNSLQKIFALIFNKRISKNQRLTNWEAPELTLSQQNYAAIDAWACVEIYNHLRAGKFHPEQCPYIIDDATALMLQSSVGIHMPLTHPVGDEVNGPILPDPQPAGNSSSKPAKATRRKKSTKAAVSKSAKATKEAKTPAKSPKTAPKKSKATPKVSKPSPKAAKTATEGKTEAKTRTRRTTRPKKNSQE